MRQLCHAASMNNARQSIPRLRQFKINQNEPAIQGIRMVEMMSIDRHADRHGSLPNRAHRLFHLESHSSFYPCGDRRRSWRSLGIL
ncbi:hypothetical protein Y032_0054g2487 [Ancylostoma ceylanicum]|uniref:Uncharacterized protein n=1 Tax=Ancylostoma ceylanicum TaxID=53326 RepID=A0A016U5S9_9BILA|nr:hypothetical protein Y032_0054g2487 [Ancylostoma ceylanicum]